MTPKRPKDDTICAIATAPGRGGIGVVRVSGPLVLAIALAILDKPLRPRQAVLCNFLDADSSVMDQGIALLFPAPNSFTGEDVLELQGHGGPAVLRTIVARCQQLGARLAQPGEFTLRAYLNDKLDLAQAESVVDLINASSSQAAKSALRSLRGEFSQQVNHLVQSLIKLRMLVESTLDFPEEELEFLQAAKAKEQLAVIRAEIDHLLRNAKQGKLLRDGLQVVLIGQPNVGKSSLLNKLAGEEVAIVTPIAGTTRDTVREEITLNGVPLHIIDTAGLRHTEDAVEKIGIERTWAAIEKADLALVILDASFGITPDDRAIMEKLPNNQPIIEVFNKVDLMPQIPEEAGHLYISAKTGQGLENLQKRLLQLAGWQQTGEEVCIARERHVAALQEAQQHLAQANENWQYLELMAEELTLAQKALSSITGEFTADDLLGEIFSKFCIGK